MGGLGEGVAAEHSGRGVSQPCVSEVVLTLYVGF